jgi:hypothetical protein
VAATPSRQDHGSLGDLAAERISGLSIVNVPQHQRDLEPRSVALPFSAPESRRSKPTRPLQ